MSRFDAARQRRSMRVSVQVRWRWSEHGSRWRSAAARSARSSRSSSCTQRGDLQRAPDRRSSGGRPPRRRRRRPGLRLALAQRRSAERRLRRLARRRTSDPRRRLHASRGAGSVRCRKLRAGADAGRAFASPPGARRRHPRHARVLALWRARRSPTSFTAVRRPLRSASPGATARRDRAAHTADLQLCRTPRWCQSSTRWSLGTPCANACRTAHARPVPQRTPDRGATGIPAGAPRARRGGRPRAPASRRGRSSRRSSRTIPRSLRRPRPANPKRAPMMTCSLRPGRSAVRCPPCSPAIGSRSWRAARSCWEPQSWPPFLSLAVARCATDPRRLASCGPDRWGGSTLGRARFSPGSPCRAGRRASRSPATSCGLQATAPARCRRSMRAAARPDGHRTWLVPDRFALGRTPGWVLDGKSGRLLRISRG